MKTRIINLRASLLFIAYRCLIKWFKLGNNRSAFLLYCCVWDEDGDPRPNTFEWQEGSEKQIDVIVDDLFFDKESPLKENIERVWLAHYHVED